ncbi:hypothetical protein VTL71DRAFT_14598 [Oculimacula yallundae]|uniref:FAD-binding PCMH-type domain-containing protein n=1 Tax=Oculimacula yallundae TaxID=86028 RepID=A0ABR4CL79_9HELO
MSPATRAAWLTAIAFSISLSPLGEASPASHSAPCRNIPGDDGWPAITTWDTLNSTVRGRLIKTIPIAHACHDPTYENSTCQILKEQWGLPALQVPKPAEILAPYFQNQTCDPYTVKSRLCTLGNYASYSINVTNAADIQAGLLFAQTHNIRLVVKNTGHDFFGKSTGKGALALWTHNLDTMKVIPRYNNRYHNGPALKVGAGVMGGDASLYASQHGYRVVTGGCPTVGVAGGFTQGGGMSLLSGLYGLGADNVLEWEVVTAAGKHLIVTPSQHADLFWALSGGGGGTYAVVLSMTVRLFNDGIISRAGFVISTATTGSTDSLWEAVDVFHSHIQPIIDDHGISIDYVIGQDFLNVFVVTAPNRTSSDVIQILRPLTSALSARGLSLASINFAVGTADSYQSHYDATLGPILAVSSSNSITSGRFISRTNMALNVAGIGKALRSIVANGHFTVLCTALNANGIVPKVAANSVQPEWRNATASCAISGVWDWSIPFGEMLNRQEELTSHASPAFEAATPGSATYLNEGNFQQVNWQKTFYGANYKRLQAIKRVYDPADLFYGLTAVGSEAWLIDSDEGQYSEFHIEPSICPTRGNRIHCDDLLEKKALEQKIAETMFVLDANDIALATGLESGGYCVAPIAWDPSASTLINVSNPRTSGVANRSDNTPSDTVPWQTHNAYPTSPLDTSNENENDKSKAHGTVFSTIDSRAGIPPRGESLYEMPPDTSYGSPIAPVSVTPSWLVPEMSHEIDEFCSSLPTHIDNPSLLPNVMMTSVDDPAGKIQQNTHDRATKQSTAAAPSALSPLLHISARQGNRSVLQILLKHGSAVDERDIQGRTALHVAAESGHESIVSLLLSNCADIGAVDMDGKTALYYAVSESRNEVVEMLLSHRQ